MWQEQAAAGLGPCGGAAAVAQSRPFTYPVLLLNGRDDAEDCACVRTGHHSSLSSTAFTADAC